MSIDYRKYSVTKSKKHVYDKSYGWKNSAGQAARTIRSSEVAA